MINSKTQERINHDIMKYLSQCSIQHYALANFCDYIYQNYGIKMSILDIQGHEIFGTAAMDVYKSDEKYLSAEDNDSVFGYDPNYSIICWPIDDHFATVRLARYNRYYFLCPEARTLEPYGFAFGKTSWGDFCKMYKLEVGEDLPKEDFTGSGYIEFDKCNGGSTTWKVNTDSQKDKRPE